MRDRIRIAYFAHSLRSDWNNGNAHFLRGLMRALISLGHDVSVFEAEKQWSLENLQTESRGPRSLADFNCTYPEIKIHTYGDGTDELARQLRDAEVVILHEWHLPDVAKSLLSLKRALGFKLLFHDTHHRASSNPEQMKQFDLERFDGVLAFGESLRDVYYDRIGIENVWTLHEAADTTVFRPLAVGKSESRESSDVVWIGNWGDGERSAEIASFFLEPAKKLSPVASFSIYGVRYPGEGLQALRAANVCYGGYLPNLDAPGVYASAKLTTHIPRQQYSYAMTGIPTIRVFEALACGIPLISAPWKDSESLFRPGDFLYVDNAGEMTEAMCSLLRDPALRAAQAQRGLETILERHTCNHRARELTAICEELLS